jgi:hypothetical protein
LKTGDDSFFDGPAPTTEEEVQVRAAFIRKMRYEESRLLYSYDPMSTEEPDKQGFISLNRRISRLAGIFRKQDDLFDEG